MGITDVGAQVALANMRWEFHSAKEFERFSHEWDEISLEASSTIVLDAVFVALLLKEFGTGRELLAIGYRGDSAQAMTVLQRKYGAFWETFQPAQAPLGAWIHRPPHTLESLVPGLLNCLPGFALAIGITQQDPDLIGRPEDLGTVTTLDSIRASRVTLSGSFDAYWAARAKNLRNTLKQQRSLLEKNGAVLRLDAITDPADVAKALDDYGRLENSRWKPAAGTAIRPDHSRGESYGALLEQFCRRGAGKIYRYWHGDAVAAMDLCIESKDTLIVLSTACDETIRESYPASLMRQEYFQHVFNEARIKRIEFFGNFMDRNIKWGDEVRTLYHANFYRWAALSRAHRVLGRLTAESPAAVAPSPSTAVRAPATAVRAPATVAPATAAAAPGPTQDIYDTHRWSWLAELRAVLRALGSRPQPFRQTDDSGPIHRGAGDAGQIAVRGHTYAVTRYQDLSALPGRYEPLFAGAGKTSLFHTLPWYRNFVQTVLAPNERVRIYAVDAATKPAAARAVLLMRHSDTPSSLFGARTLSGLTNYYTSLFGPVIEPEAEDIQGVLDALAAALAGDEFRWDVIDLHPLAVDPLVFPGLIAAFRNAGLLVQTYFCFGNWYLQVNKQTFTEYFDTRTSRLSKSGKRYRKNLEASGRFRFELFTDVQGLERGLADYNTVYHSSWKVPEPYPDFTGGLMRTCAGQGWLRLGVAYLDGTPAAAQIWTVIEGRASIYKMAYDERFAKDSVGTVLSSLLMEHVIDIDKVHEVDYLTGDDAYKKDWMSDRRERWGIVAYNLRSPKGLLLALRHLGARATKRAVDAVRNIGVAGHEHRRNATAGREADPAGDGKFFAIR